QGARYVEPQRGGTTSGGGSSAPRPLSRRRDRLHPRARLRRGFGGGHVRAGNGRGRTGMTGAPVTLRERLTVRTPLGPPSAGARRNRERLCAFIRSIEDEVFAADEQARVTLRRLLGWDDETFHAFITSPLLTHSSPHASMNAFPPMMTYPWIQRCIQTLAALAGGGRAVHIRTPVMHNNLGDLRWRP